ncbi:MAG: ATP-binding protein [Corynebacterium sp.]|uniref:ATP-binding protein n=1 Tax=Corynebacterium sp. TaxID=1720 RepID=UPI0026DD9E0E|nr:ATP-binding protein [Corynebacterium sp.]MDO4761057.1 ATP-binding protein [Corynebacterium sp.]
MNIPNPFTPTFGLTPAVPVGREGVIQAFDDALRAGPGAPARALFVVGTRGVGKTVVLNE